MSGQLAADREQRERLAASWERCGSTRACKNRPEFYVGYGAIYILWIVHRAVQLGWGRGRTVRWLKSRWKKGGLSVEDYDLRRWPETYLGKAEKMLYEHLYAHIRQGEYSEAKQVVALLSALCII